jgi:Ni,Fe-hydrogenase III large subunit
VLETGDVASRYLVRARELAVSAPLIASLSQRLRGGTCTGAARTPSGVGSGVGLVEGWRRAVAHRVELDDTRRLSRAKVVDPSFFNWPALPVALTDTIVPDFPLANKSFNQSYAGDDL